MGPIITEWGSLLLRWTHVITAIAWIGASFYFMHLDASIRPGGGIPPGKGGAAWEVHGGGFYEVRKYLVAPEQLPEHLIWHKWQSYMTWVSGFCLLIWIYYGQASLYLIDPSVLALSPIAAAACGIFGLALGWIVYDQLCKSPLGKNDVALAGVVFAFVILAAFVFQHIFSGRGALNHTGALMATMMTGNVFFVIIPNQKKVMAALIAGREPDPMLGKTAKQRSTHNNYLTLPVLFLMLSNHYPLTYSTPFAWVIVALVLVTGTVIRHYYNVTHAEQGNPWWAWAVAAVCIVLAAWLSAATAPGTSEVLGRLHFVSLSYGAEAVSPTAAAGAPKAESKQQLLDDASMIIMSRCSMCHAAQPVWDGIGIAPKGVRLDSPENIRREAPAIRNWAVLTHAMPPNNLTEMTDEERATVAAWLKSLNSG
ncbi:MAG: urate hydroxylase PuuD [Acetobacteraceae bacterium]|nr:urate hydroxylase PuuD [Acetobacteraceae bacterium]